MDEISRRQAVGVAAAAGALAVAIATEAPAAEAADEKPRAIDERAERQRALACGLTEAEADCWVLVGKAASKFFELPKLHPTDDHETMHALHALQNKLLSRPAYRRYLELTKGGNR